MKQLLFSLIVLMITIISSAAPESPIENKPPMHAVRLAEPVNIDGKLDEQVWQNEFGYDNFTQLEPKEGEPATERTVARIAYDDEALYIGLRMYDSAPDSIVARLCRRDDGNKSDEIFLAIDPYYDRRSGFFFGLNAAGTRYDGTIYNDEWTDDSWDGVWTGDVHIDDEGWTAEMRIPFSQLRFKEKDQYVWGVDFLRRIARKNEEDFIVYTPKNGSGFASRFVDLTGIANIHSGRNLEILPYSRARAAYTHPDADNPFNDGSEYVPGIGLDMKYGIGSNLTLDMTVNPDFGQVEVDPAVVNLTDYETFFQEKRPFFIEGSSIFAFGQGGSRSNWGFDWGNPNFFYSRRIGRPPQRELPDNDYADSPENANIIGAAKITGKVGNNLNVGMVHAVTAREYSEISFNGKKSRLETEPAAYYGVFRAQKEMNEGRYGIGMLSTIMQRDFKDKDIQNELNNSAYSLGLDGWAFLDSSKTWVVTSWFGATQLQANEQQMLNVQTSSRHYFQRPDAKDYRLDSTATSMSGTAGRLLINKQKGRVIFNSALGYISPGFDVNDMGFLSSTDKINMHIGGGYKWTEPGKVTREVYMLAALFQSWDFDNNTIWKGVWQRGEFEFLNYTSFEYSLAYNPQTVNRRLTRGGPLLINPPGYELDFDWESDDRKSLIFDMYFNSYYQDKDDTYYNIGAGVEWKPRPNISVSFNPRLALENEYVQWVDVFDDVMATQTFGKRYVFASMNQKELSAGIRLNWTFTPNLSLQLYAQPLLSTGDYTDFKEFSKPKSYDFKVYQENKTISNSDDVITVDPDGAGPAAAISFDNPDFDYKSLRGNAVLRWEYTPGSTFYLVWTQRRSDSEYLGDMEFNRSFNRLWKTKADNIFMIKFSYWWNM
ncbi:MAG TPA: DUF5916 domain-containing protein [bacterium]|nr:DUF5916 domain-containing protein [bacterium]HPN43551.1 DUF5916 domain-containing protein [bacterium]